MQYDSIILEMLTRIKKLEDEIAILKSEPRQLEHINAQEPVNVQEPEKNSDEENENKPLHSVSYQKTSDEMIKICYQYGKEVKEGGNPQKLADKIAKQVGMNRNSAFMYLCAVDGLLSGKVFKRAISAKAIEKYFVLILDEFGTTGLKRALEATRLHVNYRRECGQNVDSIEQLCKKYESI